MRFPSVSVAVCMFFIACWGAVTPQRVLAQPAESAPVAVGAIRDMHAAVNRFDVWPALMPAARLETRRVHLLEIPDRPIERSPGFRMLKEYARYDPFAPVDGAPLRTTLARPLLTPLPAADFHGLGDVDFVEPPDMALAVSPSWVVQGVNTVFGVYNRSGVLQHGWPKEFAAFFHVPGQSCNPSPFLSDPRALYIPTDGRFVVAALQLDGPAINDSCKPLSKYWFAVSATGNPNGTWHVYAFDLARGSTDVADFTQIGYDQNGIYFSTNFFPNAGQIYAEIGGASKAKMEAGQPVVATFFSHLSAGGALVDTVQPVLSLSQPAAGGIAQPVEFFINSKNFNNCPSLCEGVTIWAFARLLGTPKLTAVNLATKNYALPPNGDQPGAPASIATNDTSIPSTPVFRNGLISFGLNTAINNGTKNVCGILWGQAQPVLSRTTAVTGAAMYQSGYLSYSGTQSAYFPALMPDARNDVLIAYGSSAQNFFASALYNGRLAADALGTFEKRIILQGGKTTYSGSRWGDYSATAIDGLSTAAGLWMGLEYAGPGNDWATQIGAVHV